MTLEQAVKYVEHMNNFVQELKKSYANVERKEGRRFDRIACDNMMSYFVDRESWIIYGAKSSFQYNPRRVYGDLRSVTEWDWAKGTPFPNTSAEQVHLVREAAIQKNYKKRGRPRKASPITKDDE